VLKRQRARKRPAKKREIKEDERKKLEDEKKCNACACVYNAIDMRVKLFSFVDSQMNTHTHI
jgi:hypothetical protein